MEILKIVLAEMLTLKSHDFSWQHPQGTEQEFPGEYGLRTKRQSGLMQIASVCLGS